LVIDDNLLSAGTERSKQARRLLKVLGLLGAGSSGRLLFTCVTSCFLEIIAKVLDDASELKLLGLFTVQQTSLALNCSLGVVERRLHSLGLKHGMARCTLDGRNGR
jgi:hypothetical protein